MRTYHNKYKEKKEKQRQITFSNVHDNFDLVTELEMAF